MAPLSHGIADAVERALREDLGTAQPTPAADITTAWTVGAQGQGATRARILSRAEGVIAGVDVAAHVFQRIDPALRVELLRADGDAVAPGDSVLTLVGDPAAILAGERTALNFLQQLSGVATLTRAYVDAVAGTRARITDTRKTVPGLRALQKHAVRCGGGLSHRAGLYDAVLIKENHVTAAGGIAEAVRRARAGAARAGRPQTRVMCEAESLEEVQALIAGEALPDRILLDNMSPADMAAAVERVRATGASTELEATGNVSLATVRAAAETGVDVISVGALTHSAPALDLSLLFDG